MEIHGVLYHVPHKTRHQRSEELLKLFELWERRNDQVKKFSGGMKRRLEIARGFLHTPKILFLDEPTTGVDAVSRKEFWEMLRNLKQEGITILVSTPYMDEASLCNEVALMQNGKLMTTGTPKEITESFKQTILAVQSQNMFQLLQDLSASNEVDDVYSYGEYHHAVMKKNYSNESLLNFLKSKGNDNVTMHPVTPSIEDCFMQLMRNKHE